MWTISLALMLMLAPDSFRIEGRVESPVKHRFGSAILQTRDGNSIQRTYVGRDGRFGFKNVGEGHYSIVIMMDKGRDVRRGIEVDDAFADDDGRVRTSIDITEALRAPEQYQVSIKKLAISSQARNEFRRASAIGLDPAERQKRLESAIALAPEFDEALNNLGTIYLRQGDRLRAIEMFERAVAANPNSFHARVNLGGVLIMSRQYERAFEENMLAIGLRPEDSLAQAQAGLALFHLRRFDEAAPYLIEAQRLDPFAAIGPNLILAQIYEAQGRPADALTAYESFVQSHPSHPSLRYAETKVRLLRLQQP